MIPFLAVLPAVWGFVTSRVGAIVICSAVSLGMGVRWEREHMLAASAQASLDAANKRLVENEQITEEANSRERTATATAEAEHQKVVDYDARLAKLPVSQKCLLTRADLNARRLRHSVKPTD